MIYLTFEDDWAAVYGDHGQRVYQGHHGDVREWLVDRLLEVAGGERRSATTEQEAEAMNSGSAPECL